MDLSHFQVGFEFDTEKAVTWKVLCAWVLDKFDHEKNIIYSARFSNYFCFASEKGFHRCFCTCFCFSALALHHMPNM